MVQTEGFQTKEVIINNGQWLLRYITITVQISVLRFPTMSVEKNIYL